jgi:hypothetical protein
VTPRETVQAGIAVTPRETVHAGIAVTPRALFLAISKSVCFYGVRGVKGALIELGTMVTIG